MSNRFAIVENGVVVNVVIGAPSLAEGQILVECPNAGPGWLYADGVFTEGPPPAVPETPPPPTKDELMAQLRALQAQIEGLGA